MEYTKILLAGATVRPEVPWHTQLWLGWMQ